MALADFGFARGRVAPFESFPSATVKWIVTAGVETYPFSVEGFASAREVAHPLQILLLPPSLVSQAISAAFALAPI